MLSRQPLKRASLCSIAGPEVQCRECSPKQRTFSAMLDQSHRPLGLHCPGLEHRTVPVQLRDIAYQYDHAYLVLCGANAYQCFLKQNSRRVGGHVLVGFLQQH